MFSSTLPNLGENCRQAMRIMSLPSNTVNCVGNGMHSCNCVQLVVCLSMVSVGLARYTSLLLV